MCRCGAGLDLPAALQQSLQCPLLGASVDAMRCAVAPRVQRQRRAQEPVRPRPDPGCSAARTLGTAAIMGRSTNIVLSILRNRPAGCRCGARRVRAARGAEHYTPLGGPWRGSRALCGSGSAPAPASPSPALFQYWLHLWGLRVRWCSLQGLEFCPPPPAALPLLQ